MEMTGVASTGFMAWFNQYGQIIYIFVQMAFWVFVGVAAAVAAAKYSQYVDFVTGKRSGKRAAAAEVLDGKPAETLKADE
ncbi:MAG: hypothetical protein RBS17_03385 [Coriobacteriia bacterium]|nr:hypothetical protein [Coriobacteriia bacterium]